MIDVIIFSKDRAAQLDLLLRSLILFPVNNIYVLCKSSNHDFRQGYVELKKNWSTVDFMPEYDFKHDILDTLNYMNTDNILSLSDDCCFIKTVDMTNILKDFNKNVWGINLHLSESYNGLTEYTGSKKATLPSYTQDYDYMTWNWTENINNSTWGYPAGVEGNIVRRKDYIDILKDGKFTQPNEMEGWLSRNKNKLPPEMMCFMDYHLINIPVNRVQDVVQNKFGLKHNITAEELNNKFLQGYRISTDNIYGLEVNNFYKEINFEFIKE